MPSIFKITGKLTKAAIASKLMLMNAASFADITISDNKTVTQDTTTNGNITIAASGSITPVAGQSGILVDSANAKVTINDSNINANAISVTGAGDRGIDIQAAGTKATVTIGEALTGKNNISSSNNIAILVGGNTSTVSNSGKLSAPLGYGVNVDADNITITNNSTGVIQAANPIYMNAGTNETIINNSGQILGSGYSIVSLGDFKSITNNTGSKIQGSSGIFISSASVGSITNSGEIIGTTANGIYVGANLTGAITNNVGGTITSSNGASSAVSVSGSITGGINNAGTISNTVAGGKAIYIGGDFTVDITNTGGTISAVDNPIYINGDANVNITNTGGTISGGDNIIWVASGKTLTGNITNTGTISSTGDKAICLEGALVGNIVNSGTISSTNLYTILNHSPITGNITNSGTISSNTLQAFFINKDITGTLTNSGTISSPLNAIYLTNDYNIGGGVVNSGNISGGVGAFAAIDLSNRTTSAIKFTNNAGTVTGDVKLSGGGGTVFEMNGGTITGNVRGLDNYSNTYNINGGSITTLTLSTVGAQADTINLAGGTINNIVGNTNASDILNVTASSTTGGPISDVENITVKNGAVFTVNHAITNVDQPLTIEAGATLALNLNFANNTCNVTNNGTIEIANTSTLNVNKIADNGSIQFEIKDNTVGNFARIVNVAAASSNINNAIITLEGSGFIQKNDKFVVVTQIAAAPPATPATLVQPQSQVISFTSDVLTGDLRFTANRRNYADLANSDGNTGVAVQLDGLIPTAAGGDPDILAAIIQLDHRPTTGEFNEGLKSLAPNVDGGLEQAANFAKDKQLNAIGLRINDLRIQSLEVGNPITGYMSGDEYYGMGLWTKAFGGLMKQNARGSSPGYNASLIGLVVGFDRIIQNNTLLGGAIGYSNVDVDSKGFDAANQDVTSYQLTLYGSHIFNNPFFIDIMASLGINNYKNQRQISIGTFQRTALGKFDGWQYSANIKGGYTLAISKYTITPFVQLQYSYTSFDSYTETSAGGVGLTVSQDNINEFAPGVGLHLAMFNEYLEATYAPEFHWLMSYDTMGNTQETFANFIGGGTQFNTFGFKPSQLSHELGIGLKVYTKNSGIAFSMNYDLEIKQQFLGHLASMKVRYEW